jgi:serine/threonine protein phosphatase PrpC
MTSPVQSRSLARATAYSIDIAAKQIQGTRKRQEDSYLTTPLSDAYLVAIADGVGGGPCGDDASRIAIEALRETIPASLTQDLSPQACSSALFAGVTVAHVAVKSFGAKNSECQRLCTTLVAALILPKQDSWIFASTGDSYLYHVDGQGTLSQINTTHKAPDGRLTSCIGAPNLLIDGAGEVKPLRRGETLLLASDGLDTLTRAEVAVIVEGNSRARETSLALLQAVTAIDHPKQDNATVVVVRVN